VTVGPAPDPDHLATAEFRQCYCSWFDFDPDESNERLRSLQTATENGSRNYRILDADNLEVTVHLDADVDVHHRFHFHSLRYCCCWIRMRTPPPTSPDDGLHDSYFFQVGYRYRYRYRDWWWRRAAAADLFQCAAVVVVVVVDVAVVDVVSSPTQHYQYHYLLHLLMVVLYYYQ
jgi:hypothetical protein